MGHWRSEVVLALCAFGKSQLNCASNKDLRLRGSQRCQWGRHFERDRNSWSTLRKWKYLDWNWLPNRKFSIVAMSLLKKRRKELLLSSNHSCDKTCSNCIHCSTRNKQNERQSTKCKQRIIDSIIEFYVTINVHQYYAAMFDIRIEKRGGHEMVAIQTIQHRTNSKWMKRFQNRMQFIVGRRWFIPQCRIAAFQV